MLNEFLTNKSIDAFISSPGTIATERYIERHVLPSRNKIKGKFLKERFDKILLDAGNRHGRRYTT